MLMLLKRSLLVAFCSIFLLSMFVASVEAADNAVVAKVETVDITFFEVKREMHRILPMNSSFHGGISAEKRKEVRQKALNNLFEQAYKILWAKEHGLKVTKKEVDKRLEAVRDKFTTSDELKKALGKETIVDFESSVERMLLAKKAEEIAVDSKINFSEAEVKEFYEKNTFMYQLPKRYRASHILIKVDPTFVGEEREKLVKKAHDLAEKAKVGEDFYNLAYYNSDEDTKFVGGDIGYFNSGQTVKEFENAIKDLNPGDIVGPVETLSGFHIIQLTDVQEPRLMTYSEVKDKIKQTVENKKRKALYEQWIATLTKQYTPEIIDPALK